MPRPLIGMTGRSRTTGCSGQRCIRSPRTGGTCGRQDAQFGKDGRGDELPEELRRRETRLAKLREAKQALEDQARETASVEAEQKARDRGEDEDTVAERSAEAGKKAVPKPKAQRNFTDPESKIMKTADGSFHQCFNAQAVVDAEHQVIVAADLNDCAADVANLIPLTKQVAANTGQTPRQMLADAGYCSADNLDQAAQTTASTGTEFFIATGRTKHDDPIPKTPRGPIPADATGQAADGSQAHHEEGPGRLCQTQGDRRAGLRADEHPAKRQTTSPPRSRRRTR
jgi:hypothetical protein